MEIFDALVESPGTPIDTFGLVALESTRWFIWKKTSKQLPPVPPSLKGLTNEESDASVRMFCSPNISNSSLSCPGPAVVLYLTRPIAVVTVLFTSWCDMSWDGKVWPNIAVTLRFFFIYIEYWFNLQSCSCSLTNRATCSDNSNLLLFIALLGRTYSRRALFFLGGASMRWKQQRP